MYIYVSCLEGNKHLHPDSHSFHPRPAEQWLHHVASLEEKSPFFKMLPEKVQDWYFEEPLGGYWRRKRGVADGIGMDMDGWPLSLMFLFDPENDD